MDQKHLTPTEFVAKRVREFRRRLGWSAEMLAQEMTRVGVDWNRGVVAKLETGRRESVSVAEWLALAYIFRMSPLVLLLPDEDVNYPVTPTAMTSSRSVYEWFVGERLAPLPASDNPQEVTDEDRAGAWVCLTRALRYVPEPSANWQVNNALQMLKNHSQRIELEREKHSLAVEAQLAEMRERLDQLRKGGEGGESADQTDPGR